MFSYTNGAHEIFYLSFVLWSFPVFGYRFDGFWNKEWQEPKIGDAQGTKGKIQGQPKA